jgi:hypothetical protein
MPPGLFRAFGIQRGLPECLLVRLLDIVERAIRAGGRLHCHNRAPGLICAEDDLVTQSAAQALGDNVVKNFCYYFFPFEMVGFELVLLPALPLSTDSVPIALIYRSYIAAARLLSGFPASATSFYAV